MRGSAHTQGAARRAARQHGNITFADLRAAGLSAKQVEARHSEGWLIQRHRGVYAIGHVPRTRESRFMAAVLALGDGAALSHRAAGGLWQIVRGATPVEVTTAVDTGRRHRDGITVHRNALRPDETVVRDGIHVTTVLRTVLDCAAVLHVPALSAVFEEAQVRHGLDPNLVAAECLSRRGHRGNARLGRLLVDAVDPVRVRSVLELRFLRLCARHGIERPLVNAEIGRWRPDFHWPAHALVVETDGYAFHRTAWARKRDALKDEHMRSIGLRVLRLTWADVTDRAPETAARVLAQLRAAA